MMEPLMKKMTMKMTHFTRFSGSRKRFPLPSAPKMLWETTTTYGAMSPFWFSGGMGTLHKERRSVTQHSRDHTGSFTKVRAVARHKTLLLLWWIDDGWWWKNAALSAQ